MLTHFLPKIREDDLLIYKLHLEFINLTQTTQVFNVL